MNRRSARFFGVLLGALTLFPVLATAGCDEDDSASGGGGGSGGHGGSGGAASCDEKELAPVPDTAKGVAIDFSKGYYTEQIGAGLYFLTNGQDQVMFLTTGQGVILVDAPPSLQAAIPQAIAEVTSEQITHVVYSHFHSDHIGGTGELGLGPDVEIVAQEATATAVAAAKDPRRPAVTTTVGDSLSLQVGSQTLELSYKGTNHVPGNLFIHAPAQKVLMVVDVVWPGWVPFTQLGLAKDVGGYLRAVDDILAYDFDVFIGGHVGRYGTRADIDTHKAYLADLQNNAGAALASVDFSKIAAETGYENTWNLVDSYFDELVTSCAASTEAAWVGKLGGADVWSSANCFAMIQHFRID